MNFATGSATPPSTVMPIMPTRTPPPGAISNAGVVCPKATPDSIALNAIERRIRPMRSPGVRVDRNSSSLGRPRKLARPERAKQERRQGSLLQRPLEEARGRKRLRIVTVIGNGLHADRQTAVGDISRHVHARRSQERPELIETGIAC